MLVTGGYRNVLVDAAARDGTGDTSKGADDSVRGAEPKGTGASTPGSDVAYGTAFTAANVAPQRSGVMDGVEQRSTDEARMMSSIENMRGTIRWW